MYQEQKDQLLKKEEKGEEKMVQEAAKQVENMSINEKAQ